MDRSRSRIATHRKPARAGRQPIPEFPCLSPSTGTVVPLGSGSDFPAQASFDVFFEVEVLGVATLQNSVALKQQAQITEIPPRNIALTNANTVLLTDILDPNHVDRIRRAFHWMCPPPFPPDGPCPVPCSANPFPICQFGDCPTNERCVDLPGAAACECLPVGFPPAGTDLSPSSGIFEVELVTGEVVEARVDGEVKLSFSDPDPATRVVQTEILSMDLSGSDPIIGNLRVKAGSQSGVPGLIPSPGKVTPINPGSDFPALATFDVFFEVEAGVSRLRNQDALKQQAEINEIPPRNLALTNLNTVLIIDEADPTHIDRIRRAFHWMCPPPFPPNGPCPIPCSANPFPTCQFGACPTANERCVELPGAAACECLPVGFPPAGTDLSPSSGSSRSSWSPARWWKRGWTAR